MTSSTAAPFRLQASVVEKYTPEGTTEEQSYWTEVGRAFAHSDGKGYNLAVRQGLSLSGSVVLTSARAEEGAPAPEYPECHKAKYLEASVVEKYTPEGSTEERAVWTPIGRAFPHRNGAGFNLQIRQGLAVFGSIVLRMPRPQEQQQGQNDDDRSF